MELRNLRRALEQVQRNKGAPGVDGMSVKERGQYVQDHWSEIVSRLLEGTYRPQPVRRVEIPKPSGGVRVLGVPTVLDRFIQQALLAGAAGRLGSHFFGREYGFRPGCSAHQAIAQAQKYVAQGYRIVVDLDLEKFFDWAGHDILMGLVAKQVLKLIRRFLSAGAMEGGLASQRTMGTPQGEPLSPLLSNLKLDVLDKRGHRFVRYAGDCNIFIRSQRAGHGERDMVRGKTSQAESEHGKECARRRGRAFVSGL